MTGDAQGAGAAPVDPDRPFVDGTGTSSDELRAEVDARTGTGTGDVDELRADVAGTVVELAARLDDVRARRDDVLRIAVGAVAAVVALLLVRRAAQRRNRKMP